MEAAGYLHPQYAASLADYGTPRELAASQAWVLERPIPGTSLRDGMGCYPIWSCGHWERLADDLRALDGLVCVWGVADPFGAHDPGLLRQCFPDLFVPFKQDFFADLSRAPEEFVCAHHRRNARKALSRVAVERCASPAAHGAEWIALYRRLIARHAIRGIAAFSDAGLCRQLEVPGLEMYRARCGGETVGISLWMVQNGIAYYHLAAYSDLGYQERASFALFWTAFDCLRKRGIGFVSLGAGAGLHSDPEDGLTRFKQGWSTGTRTTFLCGRILDRQAYERLAGAEPPLDYFPLYRQGEFG